MVFVALLLAFLIVCVALILVVFDEARTYASTRLKVLWVTTSSFFKSIFGKLSFGFSTAQTGAEKSALAGGKYLWAKKKGLLALIAVVLAAPAAIIYLYSHFFALDMDGVKVVKATDERVWALLEGEKLEPPPPLPPEVFATQEVEIVRPLARYANRKWEILDPDFRQRLLVVFKLMREEHGYELVLLEGYRSPERQEKLLKLGRHLTKAGACRSYHQFGLAADVAFRRHGKIVISEKDPWAMTGYELYGQVAESVGLTWGGRWSSIKDFGHVELKRKGLLGTDCSMYYNRSFFK